MLQVANRLAIAGTLCVAIAMSLRAVPRHRLPLPLARAGAADRARRRRDREVLVRAAARARASRLTLMRFCDEQDFGFGWLDDDERDAAHVARARRRRRRVGDRSRCVARGGGACRVARRAARRAAAARPPQPRLRVGRRAARRSHTTSSRAGESTARHSSSSAISRNRFWREVALWWPEQRVLVCADALGTIAFFCAPGERARRAPAPAPQARRARCGGSFPSTSSPATARACTSDASAALHEALRTSRRRLPGALRSMIRSG